MNKEKIELVETILNIISFILLFFIIFYYLYFYMNSLKEFLSLNRFST